MVINELDRYDRQKRIWGEKGQTRLNNSKVTIVGSGKLAGYSAIPLAALGVGQLRILGSEESKEDDFLLDVNLKQNQKGRNGKNHRVKGFSEALKNLNPNVNLINLPVDLESKLGEYFLQESDVIIEATNNPRSKAITFEAARQNNIPVLSTGVAESYGKLMQWTSREEVRLEHFMPQYQGFEQGSLLSLLWGGVITEEVKKIILGAENQLQQDIYYNRGSPGRFDFFKQGDELVTLDKEKNKEKSILVIGAGALGNIMTMALAEMGYGFVDYLDYDIIESTNLNRQVLFYDAVDKFKAEVLADKHAKINPEALVYYIQDKFEVIDGCFSIDRYSSSEKKYDLILDLVDNLYARATIAAYAVKKGISLVSAASSPDAAQVAVYVPGETSCMDHVFSNYYKRGKEEEIIRRQSCIAQPDPSVIMTNQIAAGLAAMEMIGNPINGSIKYAANLPDRFGINSIADICNCHEEIEKIPDMEIKDQPSGELKK